MRKKETRGRKATGRVRNKAFSGKFTEQENEEIKAAAKKLGTTQSDAVMAGIRKLK